MCAGTEGRRLFRVSSIGRDNCRCQWKYTLTVTKLEFVHFECCNWNGVV